MKIIGSSGDKRWIIEATTDDIASLCGFANRYVAGFDQGLHIGSTFEMGTLYSEARTALDTHKAALDAAKTLRRTADKFLSFFDAGTAK